MATEQTATVDYDAREIQSVAMWVGLALTMWRKLGERDLYLARADLECANRAACAIGDAETRARALTLIDAAARLLCGYTYYSVVIRDSVPSTWNRFPSKRAAEMWASERLAGEPYSVRVTYAHSEVSGEFRYPFGP